MGLIIIALLVTIVFGGLSGFLFYKYSLLNRQLADEFSENPHFAEPNNAGEGLSFTTINGFGHSLQGKFRKASIGGHPSHISYRCKQIGLFAIYPAECLRIIPTKGGKFYILGSDIDDEREIRCIRLRFYAIGTLLIALLALMILIMFCLIFIRR